MKHALLLAAFAAGCSFASAQTLNLYKPSGNIAVEKGAKTMSAPFGGGFNVPQFAIADLNNDGKPDLVTFEGYGQVGVSTFINHGTSGNPSYEYAPQYAWSFPMVFNYLILRDYNRDGIADLFCAGLGGFSVYKGRFANSMLQFDYVKDLHYEYISNASTGALDTAPAYVGNSCIPGIEDVDGDGDLDFLSFSILGSRILYYENTQVEDGLSKDTIRLRVRHGCWGNALQSYIRAYTLGVDSANCPLAFRPAPAPTPDNGQAGSVDWEGGRAAAKGAMHGSNTLCFFDADNDGDIDFLNGNGAFNDIQLLRNGRAQYGTRNDTIVSQDTLWQSNGMVYEQSSYPAAFHIDFNNDGKQDILIAPHGSGRDRNQIWYYQNNGTPTAPRFDFTTDSLLSNDVIDVGSNSRPLFYDYNKDGKPDLLVGGLEKLQNGQQLSRLHYYENITTVVGQPRFQFKALDLVNLSVLPVYATDPAVGDVDGDGLDDLVIGGKDGNLLYFRNTAATANVPPVWMLQQMPMTRNGTDALSVFSNASPAFYDINKDGKPDLVIGQTNGSLTAYLNTNTVPGSVSFGPAIDSFGGAIIPASRPSFGYSRPFLGKLQAGSNKDYLLMGCNDGVLYVWDSIGTGNTTRQLLRIADTFSHIVLQPNTAPAVADVDGDGKLEMVIGTDIGGLQLFWTGMGLDTDSSLLSPTYVKVFPNPANEDFAILRQGVSGRRETTVSVMDITGRRIYQEQWGAGQVSGRVSTQSWPAGMYMLQIAAAEGVETQKITITH